jgi:hypothetical protein
MMDSERSKVGLNQSKKLLKSNNSLWNDIRRFALAVARIVGRHGLICAAELKDKVK